MSKRLLILSYHFPPFNATASQRAASFAHYLPASGWDVEVCTFDWEGEKNDRLTVHRIAPGNLESKAKPHWTLRTPIISTLRVAWHYLRGTFDYQSTEQRKRMDAWLRSEDLSRFDLVLGIFSPHFHLPQAAEIHRKWGIPFVIDFRDMWDDRVLQTHPDLSRKELILHGIVKRRWQKWMQHAAGHTSVSSAMNDQLSTLFNQPGKVIFNGYEALEHAENGEQYPVFTISHAGTIVEWKQIDTLFEGIAKFIEHTEADIHLVLAGVHVLIATHVNAALKKHNLTDYPGLKVMPRIPRTEAIDIIRKSHVLFYPPAVGFEGVYSSRIFEFMASGNPIVVAPKGDTAVDELMAEYNNGGTFETASEVAAFIGQQYQKFKAGETTQTTNNMTAYTREAQAIALSDYLKSCL
jgi:glycosyltransferase involved in cell wall biosynthesis